MVRQSPLFGRHGEPAHRMSGEAAVGKLELRRCEDCVPMFRCVADHPRVVAAQVGLEPTTLRLTAGCSAIELLGNRGLPSGSGGDARNPFWILCVAGVIQPRRGLPQRGQLPAGADDLAQERCRTMPISPIDSGTCSSTHICGAELLHKWELHRLRYRIGSHESSRKEETIHGRSADPGRTCAAHEAFAAGTGRRLHTHRTAGCGRHHRHSCGDRGAKLPARAGARQGEPGSR